VSVGPGTPPVLPGTGAGVSRSTDLTGGIWILLFAAAMLAISGIALIRRQRR
jgi:hypothetical protein